MIVNPAGNGSGKYQNTSMLIWPVSKPSELVKNKSILKLKLISQY